MVVGQVTPTDDTPMEVDSENPIPNLNSKSDSHSRETMGGAATPHDIARAEMVVQAQETLLRSKCLSSLPLSLPPPLSHTLPLTHSNVLFFHYNFYMYLHSPFPVY